MALEEGYSSNRASRPHAAVGRRWLCLVDLVLVAKLRQCLHSSSCCFVVYQSCSISSYSCTMDFRRSQTISSSLLSSRRHQMVSMDMLDAAVTWTPKTGKNDDPVQVAGLGILPAVSMDNSKHSIAMSDCCHLRDCCEVQYYCQTITAVAASSRSKSRKEDTTMIIKSKPHDCCQVMKSRSCHRSALG